VLDDKEKSRRGSGADKASEGGPASSRGRAHSSTRSETKKEKKDVRSLLRFVFAFNVIACNVGAWAEY